MKKIQESSLSRIWQHITKEGSSFGVISAYKFDLSEEENLERHEILRNKIRSYRYGYIEQKSGYTYKNEELGIKDQIEEKSFFIPGISLEDCQTLSEIFDQESYLYKDDNGFGLFMTDSGKEVVSFVDSDELFSFKPKDFEAGYSQLVKANTNNKGKFSYLSELYIPSRADAIIAGSSGKLAETKWIDIK
jgi:hypothetical protein